MRTDRHAAFAWRDRFVRVAAAGSLCLAGGCSVADNLSFAEIVTELDGIVTITGEGTDRSVRYATQAPVSAWYMRQFWLVPIRWLLGPVFGYRSEDTIENPSEHVRELLLELPDELGRDLVAGAQATTRFGWIAELDQNGRSRVAGIDGLVAVAARGRLPIFAGDFAALGEPLAADRLDGIQRTIAALRPEARTSAFDAGQRQAYAGALASLTERPLALWPDRLLLVEDLLVLLQAERERDLVVTAQEALRAAIRHCIEGVLLRAVEGRDPRFVEVRLCAMEQVRRLAGPRGVPLLLAVMAATPQQRARFEPAYDPDPLIQLRLIHYCGQLSGEVARMEVRLPGREGWQATAPVDFLAQTVLTEQAYYSKLRTPAMAALSLSLGRPTLDPDPAWVREWYRQRQSRSS
ncbi:MAG: hypothetical protein KF830_13205 [Planctomycetes bacterium]|nr:hypothetical protein [Planctomycetota bacterium]